jgi:hypothetical protein
MSSADEQDGLQRQAFIIRQKLACGGEARKMIIHYMIIPGISIYFWGASLVASAGEHAIFQEFPEYMDHKKTGGQGLRHL